MLGIRQELQWGLKAKNMHIVDNEDGRLELFARGWNGDLIHTCQVAPGGAWSEWESLGVPHPEFRSPDGRFVYGSLESTPTVSRNRDGRLEVFALGLRDPFTADLVHIWQPAANSGPWSGWASLGGNLKLTAPAVGRNADGRIEVFACTSDNALWHIWQTAPNNGWSNWERLGGVVLGTPAVVETVDGRLEVFVRGSDWRLWHIWQTSPNGGWSGWEPLGGVMLRSPVVSRNFDGRLEVFSTVGAPYPWNLGHIWQTWPNGRWSNWAGDLLVTNQFETPSVGQNADGRLEMFGNGSWLGRLQHQWQTWPNLSWSSWNTSSDRDLGGVHTSTPVVARNADGRMEVFARGTDYKVYHLWQTARNNGWSDWDRIGDRAISDLGRTIYEGSGRVWGSS
jgi:hypothetical protein